MFIDYYSILEINENATLEEISQAFKVQALKWHPDKNPNVDTTQKMQLINEARLILRDSEARKRYNAEYQKFKTYEKQKKNTNYQGQEQKINKENTMYNVQDDILNKWMNNAKKQSVDLAKQTIEDFKNMVVVDSKAAGKTMITLFIRYVIVGIIFSLIFSLIKTCNH